MILVSDVMSTRLLTLTPADSLKMARELMHRSRIRHIPVVTQRGDFVGLLTQRDLLRAQVSHFAGVPPEEMEQIEGNIPVAEVMSTEVLTIPPHMPLKQAAELLLAHKFGCLPVMERGRLCGILTEADFVKLSIAFLDQQDTPQT